MCGLLQPQTLHTYEFLHDFSDILQHRFISSVNPFLAQTISRPEHFTYRPLDGDSRGIGFELHNFCYDFAFSQISY